MTAQLKNNAIGYLAADISASDTGISLGSGEGSAFPTLTGAQYFYATLVSAAGTLEIVKVTARVGDALTVVRAQEGTIANGFATGARVELRVTAASIIDSAETGVYTPAGASAVQTTIQAKLRETVSVKDFGAVGDGVTDDTAAIQAAITYAETFNVETYQGGRRVFIPAGEYVISSTITLAKNKLCQIVGEGQLLTTLSYTGSGVAVEVSGDNTGQNQSFYCADLQIVNDGTGTVGFKGNFLAFSGSIERVMVKGFSEQNFWIENFENGLLLQTRSEKLTTTKTGLYLKNTNGVVIIGHQCHGEGARSGNSPVNTAFASYTGSVCIYADDIESLNMQSVVCEGATLNSDVGIWLEEPANRDTPRGGVTINGVYIERCNTGIVLRGYDSDTELRNIAITNGKMTGGSPTNGIIGSNYVYNVFIDCCEIACDAGNHWKFDSTCQDIRIGRLGYQNAATGGNDSAFPGIHDGINFISTATGGEGTVTVFTASNQSGNGSPVDYTPNVITGDYRRIRAVILNINLTVNTTGSSGMAGIKILPKGEGNDSAIFYRVPYGTTDVNTAQVIVPVDGTNASITLQQLITSGASWDVDIDVYQVGVLV